MRHGTGTSSLTCPTCPWWDKWDRYHAAHLSQAGRLKRACRVNDLERPGQVGGTNRVDT
jgi:hypothetical protein